MSIFVKTKSPALLIERIKAEIEKGSIVTWSIDSDGDFTHTAEQWKYQAWIRAKVEPERVVFFIICRNDKDLSVEDYGIYHGRFTELLLNHFDKDCDSIEVTPLATSYDSVKANHKNS